MKVTLDKKTGKEIDWDKPGQIMVSKSTGTVILSTGKHTEPYFEGYAIQRDGHTDFSNNWGKSNFTPLEGPLILEND